MNTSKYPIRQSRRSLSARTTIWSSFCKVLGTFCEWQLMLPNLKSRCSCISIYLYIYPCIHTCMVGSSTLQIMSPGMKQLNSVAVHAFCIFVQQLSAWAITKKTIASYYVGKGVALLWIIIFAAELCSTITMSMWKPTMAMLRSIPWGLATIFQLRWNEPWEI